MTLKSKNKILHTTHILQRNLNLPEIETQLLDTWRQSYFVANWKEFLWGKTLFSGWINLIVWKFSPPDIHFENNPFLVALWEWCSTGLFKSEVYHHLLLVSNKPWNCETRIVDRTTLFVALINIIRPKLTLPPFTGNLSSKTVSDSWLDSVLGQSKQGVFSADFEDDNNTWVELGDGENMTLDCRVFLKQDKTVKQ